MNKVSSEHILKFNIKDKPQINKWGHIMTEKQYFILDISTYVSEHAQYLPKILRFYFMFVSNLW